MNRIIILLALLAAFAPVSTDMYLPAIPLFEQSWNEPLTRINLALSGFFVAFCVSILIFGPLSDRFGRKKPLLAGIAIYCVASILCAIATNIEQLVTYRVLQGFGAGSASAISLAIVKDRFDDDDQRGRVLSYIAIIMALAPMLAPTLGAAVLKISEWQMIFISQAVFGIFLWGCVAAMKDEHSIREAVRAREVLSRYLSFFKNRTFAAYCGISSFLMAPMFAFIAVSSTIYQQTLQLGALQYGLLFAFNALSLVLGNLLYMKLQHKLGDKKIIVLAIAISLFGGIVQLFLAPLHGVLVFALPMFLITFGVGMGRAPSVNAALQKVNQHVGTASSVLVFSNFFIASIAMLIASIEVNNQVALIAIITVGACTVNAVLMLGLRRSSIDNMDSRINEVRF